MSKKSGFLSTLLGTLGASVLGDLLTKNLSGRDVIRAREGTIRAGYESIKILTPHPLTNFELKAYYQNEPRFNGVYSRDNLPDKIKMEHM